MFHTLKIPLPQPTLNCDDIYFMIQESRARVLGKFFDSVPLGINKNPGAFSFLLLFVYLISDLFYLQQQF